jgi:integrase
VCSKARRPSPPRLRPKTGLRVDSKSSHNAGHAPQLPPFLHREITRHKRPVWYFRRGKGPRIRMPGEFNSVEFNVAYDAALKGARPARLSHAEGTFAWGLAAYRKSQAWTALSPATHAQRDGIFKGIEKALGESKLTAWTRGDIAAGRDKRASTPTAAVAFLKAMRGFFAWAVEAGLVKSNPVDGVKVVASATEGHTPWTDDDVAAYRARWPLGTRQRVAFEVLRETGLRRGDAVLVGPPNVRDGVIRLATEKTGERVAIRMSDALVEAIDAGPCGDMTFIVGAAGRRLSKEVFGNIFREWCGAAGVVGKSAHGLRKTADAIDGYSDAELSAKFGWTGRGMPLLYTRSANREKPSLAAAERVKVGTKSPAPTPQGAGNFVGKLNQIRS